MSHPWRFLLPAPCFLLLLTACASQPLTVTREPVTLRLVAADSCGPLAGELAIAYEEIYPWITVEVEVFDSALAEQTLQAREADLALLSWLEKRPDRSGRRHEEPRWSQPFARDGIAVIVHPAAPFTEMGLAHLQQIFRGQVQEWSGTVLTIVSREEGSGTRAAFESAVLADKQHPGSYDTTLTAVVMPSSEAVIEYVARTPGAIGYVSTLRVQESVVDGVRVLPVEGTSLTTATLSDGSYPLSRLLYLVTIAEPVGEAREFAQWVLGPEGQSIISRWGNW